MPEVAEETGPGKGDRRTSFVLFAVPVLVPGERKVRRSGADERIGVVIGVVREAVSQQVPGKGTNAGVQEVLEQNVFDVLGADASGAQRGEAGLHQEDQRTCKRRESALSTRLSAHLGGKGVAVAYPPTSDRRCSVQLCSLLHRPGFW